jgi:hypothetical protein
MTEERFKKIGSIVAAQLPGVCKSVNVSSPNMISLFLTLVLFILVK